MATKLAKIDASASESTKPRATMARREWEWINTQGRAALGLEAKAFARVLPVGAALHLLKASIPEQEWQETFAACCTLPMRTAQRWMANVNNVFEFLGVDPSPKAFQVVRDQKAADDHSRELLKAISDGIKGKNGRQLQLELSARAPKRLAAATTPPPEDAADKHQQDLARADRFLDKLEDLLGEVTAHAPQFDRARLDRFNALLDAALVAVNPARKHS